jgi:hypothetical protein
MSAHPRLLTPVEMTQVSGGHIDINAGYIATAIFIAELPHMLIGFIECYNYLASHYHGEEDDHFANGCHQFYNGTLGFFGLE